MSAEQLALVRVRSNKWFLFLARHFGAELRRNGPLTGRALGQSRLPRLA